MAAGETKGALRGEIARILQAEREAAGLSLADLAARSGVNAATLTRIERGTHVPSLEMVEKILAALGLQLAVSTEPLDDLDAQLDRLAWLPVAERLARSGLAHLLETLDTLPFVIDGALAATLQGVPLPVEVLELDLAWADSDAFTRWLLRRFAYRFHDRSQEFRMLDLDPRAPGPHFWQTQFGKIRVHMGDRLPDSVEIKVGDVAYRVRPLADITAADERSARLLRRYLERL
jgi:transcriptional regulator with XRE-family HTH domain